MGRINKITVVALLLVTLALSGCFGKKPSQIGYLTVEITDSNPLTVTGELFLREAEGRASSVLIPLRGTGFSLSLPSGNWDLFVLARDGTGRIIGRGQSRGIAGGRSVAVKVALQPVNASTIPPQITDVRWTYERGVTRVSWEVAGGTLPSDEWQIWRSKDGELWHQVGKTTGQRLVFEDLQGDTRSHYYGVRFVDRYGTGPLVQGTGPLLGKLKLTWEVKHQFPPFARRSADQIASLAWQADEHYTDLVIHFTSIGAYNQRQTLLQERGLIITKELPLLQVVLAEPSVDGELSLAEWSTYAGADFFVEPNWIVHADSLGVNSMASLPDYLQAIRVSQAHTYVGRTEEVNVAILDTGLDPGYLPWGTKLVPGLNVLTGSSSTSDGHPKSHGSNVTKVLAEVAPQATFQPVKVLRDSGTGTMVDLIEGLFYAAGIHHQYLNPTPAQIINLSLGQPEPSASLQSAIEEVTRRGIIVVAASGNAYGNQSAHGVYYPAAYSEVIAVGSVQFQGGMARRSDYSHYGPGLDLVAPEWLILGTSFSTPMVSGVAALMLGSGLPISQIRPIMANTSIDLGVPGWDEQYGDGLVNAEWAVMNLTQFDLTIRERETGEVVKEQKIPLQADFMQVSLPAGEYLVEAQLNNFLARGIAIIYEDYGQVVHLILEEPS